MLTLESLSRSFGDTVAVDDLSLEIAEGEFVTLLGPSGCGKTTTLRMIAGFETPDDGRILLRDRDVSKQSPQSRGFGMVFQNYALFPHLDVYENVAFGLKVRGVPRERTRERVEEALAMVDLAGYGDRKVQQLSGGQQQRIALARALAPEPPVLLLDEPLSNLDAALRERTRAELRELVKRLGITSIFVTHDQEEAFALSDRIGVMQDGRLRQVGGPEELYHRPVNDFVAAFLGRANFISARVVEATGEEVICELPGGVRWRGRFAEKGVDAPGSGEPVRVMVRPEALRLLEGESSTPASGRSLAGTVIERRFSGAETHYLVRLTADSDPPGDSAPPTDPAGPGAPGAGGIDVLVRAPEDRAQVGDRVLIEPASPAALRVFSA